MAGQCREFPQNNTLAVRALRVHGRILASSQKRATIHLIQAWAAVSTCKIPAESLADQPNLVSKLELSV